MRILSLDLGTKTGYAHSDGGSGVWNLSPKRHESQGMRWRKFRQHLNDMLKTVDFVAYESVARHLGTHAAHIYGGLVAILQEMCEERRIDYMGVPVGTIKKYICGRGNGSKQDVINAVKGRGHNPLDHNHADALALLYYTIENLGG